MIYSNKLKELRDFHELSGTKLGELINTNRKVYNHFETEYTIIPIKHLNTIANFYNVSLDYLFELTELENYPNSLNDININISKNRLKEFRKENNLTQDKLSNFLKSNRSTISKYEKGLNVIPTGFLYMICKKYQISADYLLGKTNEPKYLK